MRKIGFLGCGKIGQALYHHIQEKGYADALKDYQGNLILAGINYDKETKHHSCSLEKIDYSNF